MTDRNVTFYADATPSSTAATRLAEDTLHKAVFEAFITEAGVRFTNLRVAYRIFGRPNADHSNIVVVFHALTGDANCAGYKSIDGDVKGWWEPLFAPGACLDKRKYCVICANHPGSCYGSSGPVDREVGADEPMGAAFPDLTVRDLARIHHRLVAEYLGFRSLALAIGGSLGGMIALEWAILFPAAAKRVAVLAAPGISNAQALAFNHIQRRLFDLDPAFRGGDYYGGPAPMLGLSLARQIAMITYRSKVEFDTRFGREENPSLESDQSCFQVQSYLDYQGEKLIRRFDANSYIKLLGILDSHDIGMKRGGIESALRLVRSKLLFVSVESDILYEAEEVKQLHDIAGHVGLNVQYGCIESVHGHDGFLIEFDQVNRLIGQFIAE